MGSSLYRPTRGAEADHCDLDALRQNRFVPDRGFAGAFATAAGSASRAGPVEFAAEEKVEVEDDLFGVIGLLTEAKIQAHPRRP